MPSCVMMTDEKLKDGLQARLSAYAIIGGDRPLPVLLIAGITALAVVAVVLLVFVVARVL